MARALDAQLLAEKLGADEDILILDIRPFLQFNKGHIRGAVNLPCSPLMLRRLQKNGHGLREYVPEDLRDRLYGSESASSGTDGVMVVVYDGQSSKIDSDKSTSPLCVVLTALEKDLSTIFFLSGESCEARVLFSSHYIIMMSFLISARDRSAIKTSDRARGASSRV